MIKRKDSFFFFVLVKMVALREGLEWLLKRRYGCQEIVEVQVPPANVTAYCLADAATQRFFAIVVDTVRIHSVKSLARNVAAYVDDSSAEVECIVVYREKNTQQQSKRHRAQVYLHTQENLAKVTCHIFSEESLCSHPLQFNIVPQDYRVVVEGTDEHNCLVKLTKGELQKLPWMRESDKAAHLLGYRAGQVVAHTKTEGNLPPTTVYRIMVQAETSA
jgi:DNA-directed RNA polymerase subunit H (RpoH/RPB5)